ncbi:MAG: glycosyltransferase family 4 protein [Phycisphaerae bacterium]
MNDISNRVGLTSGSSPVDLRGVHEVVVFTTNVGLGDWEEMGHFEREVSIYSRWAERMGSVTFLTFGDPHKEVEYESRIAPIQVAPSPKRWPTLLADFGAVMRHRRLIRGCDIIKTMQVRGGVVGVMAKWLWGRPLLVRCGFVPSLFSRHAGRRLRELIQARMESMVFRNADAVIVATDEDKQYICDRYRLPVDKVTVIGNGIDTETFRPMPEVPKEPGTVCFVGRFSPQKNLDNLIRAMAGTGLELVAYGSGDLQPDLQALAERVGVRVRWCGRVPNWEVPVACNRAMLFALPSLYEGNPKALLEAMSCGCCVVTTPVEGIRNLTVHGQNAIICRDTGVGGIREGLLQATSDPAIVERLGREAREFVLRNYALGVLMDRETSLLRTLAGSRQT